ncbi:MAG: substrate-binding domain-containing protein [Lachnospiraceae bacterium]|nr:substrate-binding domain-containing protein [Lachnospiraceae bacterium]
MSIRRTVALLVKNLEGEFFGGIVRGARMAAEEKKMNLMVVPGGMLGEDYEDNVLYKFAMQGSVDAIACTTASIAREDDKFDILGRDKSIKPTLAVADKCRDYPSIFYDNASGISEIMDYLIYEKKCTRIVMFAGPEISYDAEARLDEYRKCMERRRLRVEEKMIVRGDHTDACVQEAEKLLDNNQDAEAIVCSNDMQAYALYRVLKKRDIKIGKDILVTGFDDLGESAYMDPPLASVQASDLKLGYEACTLAGRMGDGELASDKILECHFIKRESVGYDPSHTISVFENRHNIHASTTFDIPNLTSAMVDFVFTGDVHDYQAECQKKLLEDFFYRLLSNYLGNVVKRKSGDQIEYTLSIFDRGGTLYIDCNRMFRILDSIYRVFCLKEKSEAARMDLVRIMSSIKSRVAENLERRSGNFQKVVVSLRDSLKRFSKALLSIDPGDEDRFAKLMEAMSYIGVINASIFMYDKPIKMVNGEEFELPKTLYLKAYRDKSGVHQIDEAHQLTPTADIMDYRYLEGGRNHTFYTMCLHYGGNQLGVLLIDLEDEYFSSYSLINNEINLVVSHF